MWWDQLATGVDIAALLHLFRGHALMALGRRAEFETNLAQLIELGETTGNMVVLVIAHGRVALLALLDGRFQDVAPSANRILEAQPEGDFRLSHFSLLAAVALEEGRGTRWVSRPSSFRGALQIPRGSPPLGAGAPSVQVGTRPSFSIFV